MTTFRTVLSFALGWLGAAMLAATFFPAPYLPVLSEKRAHFAAHAAKYDAVFIGSSRVYRGIVPAVFDAEMAAQGQPVRSFNFAMEAVWPPESLYRVREFLRQRPRVRWVFIELLPVNPRITDENARTLRAIYWHDWRHTALAWREIAATSDFTFGEKASWCALHAELFLRRLTQLSRAATLLELLLRPDLEKSARKLEALNTAWRESAGFIPEPATPMSERDATAFQQQTATAKNQPVLALPLHLRDAIRQLTATVRAAGAEPIFFITPSITAAENFSDLHAQGIDADLISFKYPARFPTLYDPALHFDGPHLNERGARELSLLMAREFARLRQQAH